MSVPPRLSSRDAPTLRVVRTRHAHRVAKQPLEDFPAPRVVGPLQVRSG